VLDGMTAAKSITPLTGVAAGVPYLALPPVTPAGADALVVVWHSADAPRTEAAMAAALPMTALNAWRVYLGLPLLGSRLPGGSLDGFFALAAADAVSNVFEPLVGRAVAEFPAALRELRHQLGVAEAPVGLAGASIGAMVALGVLADGQVPVRTAALMSPVIRLADLIAANERAFGTPYGWDAHSLGVAARLDFVARAVEVARAEPALLLVVGADEDPAFIRPAESLWQYLSADRPERAALVTVPDMRHALAEEPGTDPAPQTRHAALTDAVVADWFTRHRELP
jgi:pimeloyl-ACP methyl ester carboxylesterase